ncbi:MAG: hypothetical protein ABI995_00265 [Acidobacteriota bacterium]
MPHGVQELHEVQSAALSLAPNAISAREYANCVLAKAATTRLDRFRQLLDVARESDGKQLSWWQSLIGLWSLSHAPSPWEAALRECSQYTREVLVVADSGFVPVEAAALLRIHEDQLELAYSGAREELERHLWSHVRDAHPAMQPAR